MKDIKNQLKVFYSKVSKDLGKDISQNKCDGYIRHLEKLKSDIDEEDEDLLDDLEELEELGQGFGFLKRESTTGEIRNAVKDVHEQLDHICMKLGIDTDDISPKSQPQQVFHIQQSNTQVQSTEVNVDIKIQNLVQELEHELKSVNPDKSKMKNILSEILKHGKAYAPKVIELLIKYWDKFQFGGLGFV